ncbi:hypothetical protein ACH4U6_20180 [Streptomyces netropsis]|uniref:hypothetical protein n=1 Tax=Streptomyces netropsis TaxID=55404 RepID=UPI0037A1FBC8
MTTPVMRLYPAEYRARHGHEIAEVYRQAVDGAGRLARSREAADLAAHALRMRLHVSSDRRAGRLFAAAAPFVVAVLAAHAGLELFNLAAFLLDTRGDGPYLGAADLVFAGVWTAVLAAAVAALAGRWPAGRWCLAVVLAVCALLAATIGRGGVLGAPGALVVLSVLSAAILVGCPPDMAPDWRVRRIAFGAAIAIWAPLSVLCVMWRTLFADYVGIELALLAESNMWPCLILAISACAFARGGGSARLALAAMVTAALPVVAYDAVITGYHPAQAVVPAISFLLTAAVLFARRPVPNRTSPQRG